MYIIEPTDSVELLNRRMMLGKLAGTEPINLAAKRGMRYSKPGALSICMEKPVRIFSQMEQYNNLIAFPLVWQNR